jgi:hypothetical protein
VYNFFHLILRKPFVSDFFIRNGPILSEMAVIGPLLQQFFLASKVIDAVCHKFQFSSERVHISSIFAAPSAPACVSTPKQPCCLGTTAGRCKFDVAAFSRVCHPLLKVTRRFRSKMNARLTSVMFFIFLIPLMSLSTLGVRCRVQSMFCWHCITDDMCLQFGLFGINTAASAFVTPKFFVQTMFYSFVFTSAVWLCHFLAVLCRFTLFRLDCKSSSGHSTTTKMTTKI